MLESSKKQKSETEFVITGCVKAAMMLKNCTDNEINTYINNATSGDINYLIEVSNNQLQQINSSKNILDKIIEFLLKYILILKEKIWKRK